MTNDPFDGLLDYQTTDPLNAEDIDRVSRWYASNHGEGNLDLVPFISFWLEHRSSVVRGYRRFAEACAGVSGGLPPAVVALIYLHTYAMSGWPGGALYQIIAARRWGASKDDVLDMLSLAFLHGGPRGFSDVAPACSDYLRSWTDDDEVKGDRWPAEWRPNFGTLGSGIEYSTGGLGAGETEIIQGWYERMTGESPGHVGFLSRHGPDVLKALRVRQETVLTSAPDELFALCVLHAAATFGEVRTMRRAVHYAQKLGVPDGHIRHALILVVTYTTDFSTDLWAQVAALLDMPGSGSH